MISSIIEQHSADIALSDNPIERYRIRTLHQKALGIHVHGKEVLLASGGRLTYDKLLIATGRSPVIPDTIPGIQGANVFPFRTVEDARSIRGAAEAGKHAVVLGGGFVGITAAIALKRLGLAVTIIEKNDRILSAKLDKRGSAIVADRLKREDIAVAASQSDYEIVRHSGAVRSVRLASGRIIDADVVVVAIGTKPNTDAFRDSGIRINKGIVIQESLQTNMPDVYAAGDVVEYRDLVSNTYAVSAQWSNAEEMGRFAGRNMAGAAVRYDGFLSLMNTITILNVPITMLGMVDPEGAAYEVFAEDNEGAYRKIVFKKDVMVGALFINSNEDTGVYTYLIKNRIPIGKLKGMAVRGQLGNSSFIKTRNPPLSGPRCSNVV
jgi:NAD(P)H-nitrite reductase large subunit